MIKNYKQYLREEIDWKNLFRRDKKKLPHEHDEIDPYHEEIWDEEDLSPILNIAKKQGKPYDQITILDCRDNNLDNLEGIENLINLQILGCHDNNLTSLNEMKNLTNLEVLDCSINNLISLEGIENLMNLRSLYCYRNNLTNLNGIEKLTNLEILWCDNNNFSNEYKEYLRNYCKMKKIYLMI